jgi:sulfatase maturation enzyme AslB (radical SAM superfamily)
LNSAYFKGYWMVTNRCNLRCSYCVLENAPHQLKQELDLTAKKEFISHLYHQLNFRRLTLSGGEVLLIGKSPPRDFIELLKHIRTLKYSDPKKNLEIELYTNGTYLDENVAQEMAGVVDLVAITIDSSDSNTLTQLGRNNQKFNAYYQNVLKVCKLLARHHIPVKLHSVVGTKTYLNLPKEVDSILHAIQQTGIHLTAWKFYQYMSYDMPDKDLLHAIPKDWYQKFQIEVEKALKNCDVRLHFKDNEEMNASLFNILSYGNAQFMHEGDSWSTSKRTQDLRTYQSMEELFAANKMDAQRFRHFHEVTL